MAGGREKFQSERAATNITHISHLLGLEASDVKIRLARDKTNDDNDKPYLVPNICRVRKTYQHLPTNCVQGKEREECTIQIET
jgi:hypothetical protein